MTSGSTAGVLDVVDEQGVTGSSGSSMNRDSGVRVGVGMDMEWVISRVGVLLCTLSVVVPFSEKVGLNSYVGKQEDVATEAFDSVLNRRP